MLAVVHGQVHVCVRVRVSVLVPVCDCLCPCRVSVSGKSASFLHVHGFAPINWRCKDLCHLLIFAENFNILGLTDSKRFLSEWFPLKIKHKCPARHLLVNIYRLSLFSTPVSLRWSVRLLEGTHRWYLRTLFCINQTYTGQKMRPWVISILFSDSPRY